MVLYLRSSPFVILNSRIIGFTSLFLSAFVFISSSLISVDTFISSSYGDSLISIISLASDSSNFITHCSSIPLIRYFLPISRFSLIAVTSSVIEVIFLSPNFNTGVLEVCVSVYTSTFSPFNHRSTSL